LQVVDLVVVERAAVVGEGIAVVVVEGFDRSGDQGRRIHRTAAVAPEPKPEKPK